MVFQLAQFNMATLRFPLEAPESTGFREALDHVNALAEGHPGFVWRATGEGFDSAEPAHDQDPLVLKNLSVWDSAEALAAFAYRTVHRDYVRRRAAWFLPSDGPSFVLWWIPSGRVPTEADGAARLAMLKAIGPTQDAFDFRTRMPPPTLAFSTDPDYAAQS